MDKCIFCNLDHKRIISSSNFFHIIRDSFPVSDLHTLIIPKRHAETYFDLDEDETGELSKVLKIGGIYLTTCFIVNNTEYNNICERVSDVVIRTSPNKDPYHHKLDDFIKMGNKYGFSLEYCGIGNCCPRKHDIVKFIKK